MFINIVFILKYYSSFYAYIAKFFCKLWNPKKQPSSLKSRKFKVRLDGNDNSSKRKRPAIKKTPSSTELTEVPGCFEISQICSDAKDSRIASGELKKICSIDGSKEKISSYLETPHEIKAVPENGKRRKKSKAQQESKFKTKTGQVTKDTHVVPFKSQPKLILPLDFGSHESAYESFLNFVLTADELSRNDYPADSPSNPGYVINRSCGTPSTHPDRHCTRCGQVFHISGGDHYSGESPCTFHPKRITSLHGVPDAGHYLCCGGNFLAEGCTEFPYHVSAERFLRDVPFARVRRKRQVRAGLRHSVFALDCEMSYTTAGLEVTRISVVGLDGLAVYDTFVRPEHRILDHNTEFSGVTARDLEETSTTLGDVRAFLLGLMNEDSVLVGHALNNDLHALRLIHERVVDTAVVFGIGRRKPSLKWLAAEHLGKGIQGGEAGHDSAEDARICMELMLKKIHSSALSRGC